MLLQQIVPLLGKSIESAEIKALFEEWKDVVAFPAVTTCTADADSIVFEPKMRRDGIELQFGRGGHSRYKKPIIATGSSEEDGTLYTAMLNLIEIHDDYTGWLPFAMSPAVDADQLTRQFGSPKVTSFMGESTVWRQTFDEKYELIASIDKFTDGRILKSMVINFLFELDLYTDESYVVAGL